MTDLNVEKPEQRSRFSQIQYDMLIRCSEKKNVTEWNNWRKANPDEKILLEMADLHGANLYGANLNTANLSGAELYLARFIEASLNGAKLNGAKLIGALLHGAILNGAKLRGASLINANLKRADLTKVDLTKVDLTKANLTGANLTNVNLSNADLSGARLTGAILEFALLIDSIIDEAILNMTNFQCAIITGSVFHHTSTFDWEIDGIKCDYLFLDNEKKDRHNFEPREFERLYRSLPTIEYVFKNGMKWFDAVVMDQVAKELQTDNPASQLQLTSIDSKGIYPRAIFTTVLADQVQEFKKQIASRYEDQIKYLEKDRDRWIQVVLASATAPRQQISVGRDLIQAKGHVIINNQVINNVIHEIENEPDSSFPDNSKVKALDYLKKLGKDIASDQTKETVKTVLETLKPMVVPTLWMTIKGMMGG